MNPATHLYKTSVLAIRTAALAAALFVTTSAPARTAHTANPKGGGNTPAQSDPDILRYNNPGLTVDLGVGLWGIPLPVDYDGDGLKDLLVSCPDRPYKGLYFFKNIGTPRHPRFAAAERISENRLLFYVGASCPSFAEDYVACTADCSSQSPAIAIDDHDDAAIYFSSGTTGFPKAILHDHESLMHAAKVEQHHHGQTKDDVFLCIPPLYHTGAKMHWMGSLLTGGKAVLLKGTKPRSILKAVSEERCTIVWLLVPWAQDILDAIDSGEVSLEEYHLDQWRLMHIGAQPVPKSLIQRWKKLFPHHEYDTNYGLSESIGPGCVHLGVENIRKVGAIGIPGYGWEVKIVDERGDAVALGEVGELCVKGPGVMTCYYRDPKATAEVLKDGWLYTGDMAKQDDEGFIYLVDRKKDVIISGGENIYPVQIEDFLHGHEAVKDVAVIGLPDRRLGEISAAIIECKPGFSCSEEEINAYCRQLPRYKRPHKIIFADVPRNATGKIEKPKLRHIYRSENLVAAQTEADQ